MFDCCTGSRGQDLPRNAHRYRDDSRSMGDFFVCACIWGSLDVDRRAAKRCAQVGSAMKRRALTAVPLPLGAGLSFAADDMGRVKSYHVGSPQQKIRHSVLIPMASPLHGPSTAGVGIVFDTGDMGIGPSGDGLVVTSELPLQRESACAIYFASAIAFLYVLKSACAQGC